MLFRSEGSGSEFRNVQPNHKVKQWRKIFCSSKNKQEFIKFVTNEWKKDEYTNKLTRKILVITCEHKCYQISFGVVKSISEIESTQEADTRLVARMKFAAVVSVRRQ